MKRIKRIVIVANGNISETIIAEIHAYDFVIGVDRAAYWLIQHTIVPDISLGDFDSTTDKELSVIKRKSKHVSVFPAKKDATDLELAIHQAILLCPKEVLIVGAIGTRLDHSYIAIQLLEKFIGSGILVFIRDEKNECTLCTSKNVFNKNDTYKYFSILPVTDTVSVTITGCAYPLKHTIIERGSSLGISNEFVSEKVQIMVHKGIALVIRSSD
jgi:thiamine pyrophosphokinase